MPSSGITAEERVSRWLADNPSTTIEEVTHQTGLTERKIRRTQAWKIHEEDRLDDYLKDNPHATTGDVRATFGFSQAKTVGMRAWKDHRKRLETSRPPPQVKERPLVRTMLECRPDEGSADPAKMFQDREQIFEAILGKAGWRTKGLLRRLTECNREALVDHLVKSMDDGSEEIRDEDTTWAIVLEATGSWLDEHEQQRRRQGGRGS
jgi:hypothetical protein